jgi:hypothetical protein
MGEGGGQQGAVERLGSLLAIGVEQQGVRLCLLEPVGRQQRLAAWLGLQQDGSLELPQLIANACRRLSQRLGRTLWHERKQEPFLDSENAVRVPPLAHVSIGLSARPPLRVWLCAVSPTLSLAALEAAVQAAPVQVVGRTALNAALSGGSLAAALKRAEPEVLILAGGFDDPTPAAQHALLLLCQFVAEALGKLAADDRPVIFFAGNRFAVDAVTSRFAPLETTLTSLGNVCPAPNIIRTRELALLLTYFDWRLTERMDGYSRLSRWATSPGQVSSLTNNFAQLTRIWLEQEQLPTLHGLYTTPSWRLHVLAGQGRDEVTLVYESHNTDASPVHGWPDVGLVCGPWPRSLSKPAQRCWWDREGLAPIIAGLGQVAPLAMMQVLETDIFERFK